MKKILRILIIVFIVGLILCNFLIIYYKFIMRNNNNSNVMTVNIKNNPKISINTEKNKYEEEFYSKNFPYNINIFKDNVDFNGILDLKDGQLTIYDDSTKATKNIVNEYITKVILRNTNLIDMLSLYAISENNDLYYITLESDNIDDIVIRKFDLKVNYMTNLKSYISNNNLNFNVVVYAKDKHYYLMPYGVPYQEGMIVVNDKYIKYLNNVTTIDGKIIKDKKGNDIVIKHIINVDSKTNIFFKKPEEIIVTTDNRIVYVINDELIINRKKIKEFKLIEEDELNTYEITYEDETKEMFKGTMLINLTNVKMDI